MAALAASCCRLRIAQWSMGSNDAQRASLCISLLSACLFLAFALRFSLRINSVQIEKHTLADIRIPRSRSWPWQLFGQQCHRCQQCQQCRTGPFHQHCYAIFPVHKESWRFRPAVWLDGLVCCRVLSDDLCALCCLTETWWSKCSTSIWSWIVKVCAARITLFYAEDYEIMCWLR